MKKIVHVTTVHNNRDTRILYRQCRSLARAGYEVVLVAPGSRAETVEGVRVVPLGVSRSRMHRLFGLAAKAIRRAFLEKADVYHFHDPELVPWMQLLRLVTNKPVVFDVHEDLVKSIQNKLWIPSVFRPVVALLAILLLRLSVGMQIVLAELSYGESIGWVEDPTFVLNFPALDMFPELSGKYQRHSLVYLGDLTAARGLEEMLSVHRELSSGDIAVDLHLIGPASSPLAKGLSAIRRNGSEVIVHGRLPQPDALDIVARSHIGLALLHPIPNYMHSYPTKLFEYMGCGVPWVASNLPLNTEIAEKYRCGFSVDPFNISKTAEVIRGLLLDEQRRVSMGRDGYDAVHTELNWGNQEKNLLALYSRLLSDRDSVS